MRGKTTTIRDLARRVGVSETTVSLAFRPASRISDSTRARVLKTAQTLDYVPNLAARTLRRGQPRLLGALVNDLTNPFYAGMVRVMEDVAQAADHQIVVMESQWKPDREVECLTRMIQSRVRGVLFCPCEQGDEGFSMLRRFHVPTVAVDTCPLDYTGPYVGNDLEAAGDLAAAHLADVGCRRPVLVVPRNGRRPFSAFVQLRQGFASTLKKRGIRFGSEHLFAAGWTIEAGRDAYSKILGRIPDTDGILCGNDGCALGIMDALDRAGRKVGPDVAVMGIDNLPVTQLTRVSLTSIGQPHADVASRATAALLESVEREELPTLRLTLPPELIARDSTRRSFGKT